MLLYSLIVVWFASAGHRHYRPPQRPWYRSKSRPSFADMLATLRQESVREQVSSLRPTGRGSRNLVKTLLHAVKHAA
jgi:formylglycine-generating enzyme required for sulfatase activity